LGGLSKKSFLVKQLSRDPHVPSILISTGNMLFPKTVLPEELTAARTTADGFLQATRTMGGSVMGVGALDLAGGFSALLPYHQPPDFSLVSLNLVHPQTTKPIFSPVSWKMAGEVRIAVLGLTDHTAVSAEEGFQVIPWQDCLEQTLREVKGKADFILLLSNYPMAENQAIARKMKDIDCILQAGHVIGNVAPILTNNTLISQTEIRGKYLGVLDIEWNGRGQWQETTQSASQAGTSRYSNRFIAMPISMHNDPAVEAIVKQTQRRLDKIRQQGNR
jgi:2',3'-cyclic-nucleotide 2'-phosphodiesterase (5'-nucleotidase family)